ncbi:hypothetical protein [Desulfosporosinus sp. Sb-LF]|uniref:hypothetical protein n=1 Tax=Desulfosporosinus sp. Sb-LF TaxID=2560027 RepID=UPI00107F1B3C|nr:hypothetical protein [Desulfosporosinus sp. Sb-LF]TGE31840.1 hypothetical protein E4K68_14165 [Desulfosporosinus sp. Sb-LF]
MDQETREMFGKVLGLLETVKTDVQVLKTDVAGLNQRMDVMNQRMDFMGSRQDEMYLMLKGSEESRQRMKTLEEKGSISEIERDQLKMESAKIIWRYSSWCS